MNYDAILKRARKAVAAATAKINSAKVHVVDHDTDIKSLSGLVVILADMDSQNTTQANSKPAGDMISQN